MMYNVSENSASRKNTALQGRYSTVHSSTFAATTSKIIEIFHEILFKMFIKDKIFKIGGKR